MVLAAHQPMFFPATAYFYKMDQADFFILADDLQFSTRGNFNRTRIKTINGPQWLTVPVFTKGQGTQKLNAIKIDNHQDWGRKFLKTLRINYRNAAYFERYWQDVEQLLARTWTDLDSLNRATIQFARQELLIKTPIVQLSNFPETNMTNLRLVQIMQELHCTTYLVENEYRPWLDPTIFQQHGLKIEFIDRTTPHYYQQFEGFEPDLSVIDLLFNEGEMSNRWIKGRKDARIQ